MFDEMDRLLKMKAWNVVVPVSQLAAREDSNRSFSTSSAGISGIMTRVAQEDKKTKDTMDEAFSDLQSLMHKAKELVGLASRFADNMKSASSADGSSHSDKEEEEFGNMLVTMGLGSIVTKASAGALYHQELAKQLADFLTKPLSNEHGMMLLTDAYCLYNRARGTDLISPEDMYSACSLFDKLGLDLTLKQFEPSGVLVVLLRMCSLLVVSRLVRCNT